MGLFVHSKEYNQLHELLWHIKAKIKYVVIQKFFASIR